MPPLSSKKEASDWIEKQDTDAFAEWARTERQRKVKEKRYHDICSLADDGKSTKEISEAIKLSVATVRKYLRRRESEQNGAAKNEYKRSKKENSSLLNSLSIYFVAYSFFLFSPISSRWRGATIYLYILILSLYSLFTCM